MLEWRRDGHGLVPGGGWARSTLQEVGRRNWIPARSKRQQLERTDAGIEHTNAHLQRMIFSYLPQLTPGLQLVKNIYRIFFLYFTRLSPSVTGREREKHRYAQFTVLEMGHINVFPQMSWIHLEKVAFNDLIWVSYITTPPVTNSNTTSPRKEKNQGNAGFWVTLIIQYLLCFCLKMQMGNAHSRNSSGGAPTFLSVW